MNTTFVGQTPYDSTGECRMETLQYADICENCYEAIICPFPFAFDASVLNTIHPSIYYSRDFVDKPKSGKITISADPISVCWRITSKGLENDVGVESHVNLVGMFVCVL